MSFHCIKIPLIYTAMLLYTQYDKNGPFLKFITPTYDDTESQSMHKKAQGIIWSKTVFPVSSQSDTLCTIQMKAYCTHNNDSLSMYLFASTYRI